MSLVLLGKVFGQPSGRFMRHARERGVRRRIARKLQPAALELNPQAPERVLERREEFEKAALRAVIGDAGNLELSFGLVDDLANALETLGLARASDVPDPFRRVWVTNEAGARKRGVVLTCRAGEVAVFCPPSGQALAEIGALLQVRYRGFTSSVAYELRLNDAVKLPGAHVLHLTRLDGQGAIGRAFVRYPVHLAGRIRLLETSDMEECELFIPCTVLDVSRGGIRLESSREYAKGDVVRIELELPDGAEDWFAALGDVCWVVSGSTGKTSLGLEFKDFSSARAKRLDEYLERLKREARAESSAARTTGT